MFSHEMRTDQAVRSGGGYERHIPLYAGLWALTEDGELPLFARWPAFLGSRTMVVSIMAGRT